MYVYFWEIESVSHPQKALSTEALHRVFNFFYIETQKIKQRKKLRE